MCAYDFRNTVQVTFDHTISFWLCGLNRKEAPGKNCLVENQEYWAKLSVFKMLLYQKLLSWSLNEPHPPEQKETAEGAVAQDELSVCDFSSSSRYQNI